MNDKPGLNPANDGDLRERLLTRLKEQGYLGSIVSSERARDLKESIEQKQVDGLLDEDLYKEYLQSLDFSVPEGLPAAGSLISVAVPQPQVRFVFNLDGRRIIAMVPPGYLGFVEVETRVTEIIAGVLEAAGYNLIPAALPKKLLAVRSGMAKYGKNNITYVPGMGSFFRLTAFYSDLPCNEDGWREPAMMERCEKCSACIRHCPARAIDCDRFLLHAEKCIVFLNEKPYGVPFPDWVESAWHNSLVGCMLCQRACPENKDVIDWYEDGAEFSEEETRLLLEIDPAEVLDVPERLPAPLLKKLRDTGLFRELEIVPRNLQALLDAPDESAGAGARTI
jgi:epoxyqueuosine reductase